MTAFLQSDGFQITAVIALIVVMILWASASWRRLPSRKPVTVPPDAVIHGLDREVRLAEAAYREAHGRLIEALRAKKGGVPSARWAAIEADKRHRNAIHRRAAYLADLAGED